MSNKAFTKLTVVIPVGPGNTVTAALRAQLGALPAHTAVRVVCANAPDVSVMNTLISTDHRGPRWELLLATPGRARQQNTGARDATTPYLWFLHADSQLAADTLPALAGFLDREERALAYFDLRFLGDGPIWTRLNTWGAWIRSRIFGLPFGDQGLVLPRAAFERLGGFNEKLTCGEDHDLVWRARRAGLTPRPLRAPLYTSARKYAEHGWWRTTSGHLHETWRQIRRFSRAERTP